MRIPCLSIEFGSSRGEKQTFSLNFNLIMKLVIRSLKFKPNSLIFGRVNSCVALIQCNYFITNSLEYFMINYRLLGHVEILNFLFLLAFESHSIVAFCSHKKAFNEEMRCVYNWCTVSGNKRARTTTTMTTNDDGRVRCISAPRTLPVCRYIFKFIVLSAPFYYVVRF